MNLLSLLQNPIVLNEVSQALKSNPQLAFQMVSIASPSLMSELDKLRDTIFRTTTVEQQQFMAANWKSFSTFIGSPQGRETLLGVVKAWNEFNNPPLPKATE